MLKTDLIKAADQDSKKLLIALHGLGDSMEGYRWVPRAFDFPWLNTLLINAPDAYYGGFSWYDFAEQPGIGIQRSRKLLFDLLEILDGQGFPPENIVLLGFSQGCLMTLEVGIRYPRLFAGLVGISGYAHEPENLIKEKSPVAEQQKFLITHGTQDPLIPFADVKKQMQQLKAAGLNIEWHEFNKPHTIAGEEELRVIRRFVEKQLLG